MKIRMDQIYTAALAGSYLYLALPLILFLLGWCRWQVGIPAVFLVAASLFLCMREHRSGQQEQHAVMLTQAHCMKLAAVAVILLAWVGLSGVGGFVWQNGDHYFRNEMYALLMEEKWPLVRETVTEAGTETRGIVYYIGYWLPSAVVGKLLGLRAGRAAQCMWTLAGIILMYTLVCLWRRRLSVWPLVLLVLFSGLDALGVLLGTSGELELFGEAHLEHWLACYQFSSMTTQLFWVFNQAVPAWLACTLIFLGERPRNMLFTVSLLILTSTFPFAGLLPFVCYFMISRCGWDTDTKTIGGLCRACRKNWGSVQNVLGFGAAAVTSGVYISGNYAVQNSLPFLDSGQGALILAAGVALAAGICLAVAVLVMHGWGPVVCKVVFVLGTALVVVRIGNLPYNEWKSPVFYWLRLTFFYMVEAGAFLCVLYPEVKDKKLFLLNAVWLYLIPLILVGRADDFCMRASIPGLFLIMLWCIQVLDRKKAGKRVWILLLLLGIGAVTPLHEIKRSYVNTAGAYENQSVERERIFQIDNFSGDAEGIFWQYLAKRRQ